ncbi:MAG: glycerol-3-phosphate dehydrogenase/oxidase [Rhodospirillaceae bacterium]|nr:glycerol-3-phosphate dehydrogenase/oxidase [Rhodospirillaceae bacterium]
MPVDAGQPPSPRPDRAARRQALAARASVDVAIIGAGINGAGLFRDLSAQGVDCLLVDKADYGSGTSAASSRLIHGGLKYLETGEFRLVAQSTLERNLLLRNAPHYVHPLPTTIPIFSWTKGAGAALRTFLGRAGAQRSRGAAIIALGLQIYDRYGSRHRALPRHRMAGRRRALREIPGLTPRIVATGTYYDAWISHPERLVLELVQDGMALNPGSTAFNYMPLVGRRGGELRFADATSGDILAVRPRLVVNAAGPWIDRVNAVLGLPTRLIGGTKGSHLVLRHDELLARLGGRMIYFEADDGRICLVFPYLGRVLVGSTDIRADDPDAIVCAEEEGEYLLASLRALFPALRFDRGQIVYSYCGVRPLPHSDVADPGLISRDHSAPVLEPEADRPFPVLSLVGGKWTTFRGFAEEVADTVLQCLGRTRKQGTRDMPIGGGRGFPVEPSARDAWIAAEVRRSGLPAERVAALLERYGTRASAVADHCRRGRDGPLAHVPAYTQREIAFLAAEEDVLHLADIVFCRTTPAVRGQVTVPLLDELAAIAGALHGWDRPRRDTEVGLCIEALAGRHGVRLAGR